MGEHSQLCEHRQPAEVAVVDSPYLEDVVRADDDAVALGFASSVIDDRPPGAGGGVAPLAGALGVLSRPALQSQDRLVRFS